MKIAFIGGRDIESLGGIENYMFNLATNLVRRGHTPIVYCESNRNAVERVNGFMVIRRKSVGGRFLCKIILGLTSTIDVVRHHRDAQLVHYNAWPPALWSWIARLAGCQTILQGHGHEWRRSKYSPLQRHIMHFMEWFTAKLCPNVTLVSDEQTQYFATNYHRYGITIPTAVNIPPDSEPQSTILERYALRKERYFLYLGRLVQDKNPDYLIRAFKQAHIGDCKLIIAGSNDAMPEYVTALHTLAEGCSDIIFTGAVYGADKEMLLKHCLAFCIPSTLEGLAITLLEAMSYGRICIASDIEANREALGDSGVWCRAEDVQQLQNCLQDVASRPQAYAEQSAANRHRVEEQFTWEHVTDKYIKYISTLSPNDSPTR